MNGLETYGLKISTLLDGTHLQPKQQLLETINHNTLSHSWEMVYGLVEQVGLD